eukprot:6960-Rhodomonas_salina.2
MELAYDAMQCTRMLLCRAPCYAMCGTEIRYGATQAAFWNHYVGTLPARFLGLAMLSSYALARLGSYALAVACAVLASVCCYATCGTGIAYGAMHSAVHG